MIVFNVYEEEAFLGNIRHKRLIATPISLLRAMTLRFPSSAGARRATHRIYLTSHLTLLEPTQGRFAAFTLCVAVLQTAA
jgi:hypothetical protein